MAHTQFKTNPISLSELVEQCADGRLQLPDFQRSWVWELEQVRSLIASVTRSFPIGAIMTLETGGRVEFRPRPVEGAGRAARRRTPDALILDGQQRLTSLMQVLDAELPVELAEPGRRPTRRWFYLDIAACLDPARDRESAVIAVPVDHRLRAEGGRRVLADLSTPEGEYESGLFPLGRIFDFQSWMVGYLRYVMDRPDADEWMTTIGRFKDEVVDSVTGYQIPVIALDRSTSKEAVCVVFEKVNTGGKVLDAFELVTASYAAEGYQLRRDWFGAGSRSARHRRLATADAVGTRNGVLAEVSPTEFLQVVALLHAHAEAAGAGAGEREAALMRAASGTRRALLDLPLAAYQRWQDIAEAGFLAAGGLLTRWGFRRAPDLPHREQVVALAAVCAMLGAERAAGSAASSLARWFWCGALGELYGPGTEVRLAADLEQVPAWVDGGAEPATIADAAFRPVRLEAPGDEATTAAHRALQALVLAEARDPMTGVALGGDRQVTHPPEPARLFPVAVDDEGAASIVGVVPLPAASIRALDRMPSEWIEDLEQGRLDLGTGERLPPVDAVEIDACLVSLQLDPALLRADRVAEVIEDRRERLLGLVEEAMGSPVTFGRPDLESELTWDGTWDSGASAWAAWDRPEMD